jgi:RHS repeat-associated protein
MQLGPSTQISDGLMAAMALLSEKPHQGVPTSTHTLHQGFGFVISNTALGMRPVLYDEGVGSRYTGKERDAESGNDYFGARYYASNVGRWLSPDWSASEDPVPYANLSNPQSLNLYAYIQNNPLYAVDSDGHDGCAAEGMPIDCGEVNSEAFTQCPDNQCTGVSRVWYSPSGGKYDGDQVLYSTQITQFTAGANGSQGYTNLTNYVSYAPPDPARVTAQYEKDVPIIASQLGVSEAEVRASIQVATNPDGTAVVIGGHVNMTVMPNSLAATQLAGLLGPDNYNGGQGNEFARLGGLTPSVHLDQGLLHVDRFNAGAWGYLGVVPHALYDVFGGGQNGNNPMLPY